MAADSSLTTEQRQEFEARLLKASRDGRIQCATALAIARSMAIPSQEVGRVANALQIKISNCQLGCF